MNKERKKLRNNNELKKGIVDQRTQPQPENQSLNFI